MRPHNMPWMIIEVFVAIECASRKSMPTIIILIRKMNLKDYFMMESSSVMLLKHFAQIWLVVCVVYVTFGNCSFCGSILTFDNVGWHIIEQCGTIIAIFCNNN